MLVWRARKFSAIHVLCVACGRGVGFRRKFPRVEYRMRYAYEIIIHAVRVHNSLSWFVYIELLSTIGLKSARDEFIFKLAAYFVECFIGINCMKANSAKRDN